LKILDIIILKISADIHKGINSGDMMKGISVIYVIIYTTKEANVLECKFGNVGGRCIMSRFNQFSFK